MATPVNETLIEFVTLAVAEPVGATGVPRFTRVTVKVALPSDVTDAVELSGLVFNTTTRYFFPLSAIFKEAVV